MTSLLHDVVITSSNTVVAGRALTCCQTIKMAQKRTSKFISLNSKLNVQSKAELSAMCIAF